MKTYYVWTDPVRPLYPCIILIKGSDGFRGRLTAGGHGAGARGGERRLLEFYRGVPVAGADVDVVAIAAAAAVAVVFSGSVKSYQHYLTVCYRQSGNLVRFEKSARGFKSHDVT